MFALAAPVLIVFIGVGIDYKTSLSDKSRMDTAADAATIAAVNTAKALCRQFRVCVRFGAVKRAIAAGFEKSLRDVNRI